MYSIRRHERGEERSREGRATRRWENKGSMMRSTATTWQGSQSPHPRGRSGEGANKKRQTGRKVGANWANEWNGLKGVPKCGMNAVLITVRYGAMRARAGTCQKRFCHTPISDSFFRCFHFASVLLLRQKQQLRSFRTLCPV